MAWNEKRPDGTWRGVYRTADGKGKRSKGGFKYPGAALAWAEQQEQAMFRGELVDGEAPVVDRSKITFAKYAEEWLGRQTSKSPATRRRYTSAVVGILDVAPFVSTPLVEVTPAMLQSWFAAMDAEGSGVGVPTRNYRLTMIRMIFRQAQRDKFRTADGAIIDDPTEGISDAKQREGKRKRVRLTDAEVDRMLTAAKSLDPTGTYYLLTLIGVEAGLRWGEMAALSVDDVHLDDEVPYLYVWRTVVRTTGRIQDAVKNGDAREVPIGSPALAEALRQRCDDVLLLNGPGSLLLPRTMTDPRPLAYSTCEGVFSKIVEASGAFTPSRTPIGWHDLRHTFGSRLGAAHVPIADIALILGQRQTEVTRLYVHPAQSAHRFGMVARALSR